MEPHHALAELDRHIDFWESRQDGNRAVNVSNARRLRLVKDVINGLVDANAGIARLEKRGRVR